MRVAQLIGALNPDAGGGGGESYGIRLAQALAARGVTSVLATVWWRATPAELAWQDELHRAGVTVLPGVSPGRRVAADLLRAARHLAPLLHAQHLDLLHSHVEYADLTALQLRLSGRIAHWLRTAHNPREFAAHPAAARLSRLIYPLLCRAESAVTAEIAARLDQRPAARWCGRQAELIANGVDAPPPPCRDRAALRAALAVDAQTPLLICVARLSAQKGIDRLLEALALLRRHLPAELLLVGCGPDEAELRAQAAQLGLGAAVHWLGARRDAAALMPAADVAVLLSRWEGLPTVMLEAALRGVPQLVTDLPGTRVLIEDGVSGRLVVDGRPRQAADALRQLLLEREAAQRMAARAQQRAAAFSFTATADATLAWYRRTLAGRL